MEQIFIPWKGWTAVRVLGQGGFGKVYEMNVAIEEMGELIQALTKVIRGKPDFDNVAEEIADVEIAMEELKYAFNNANQVKEWKHRKILRLSEKIIRGYD